jgi:hypothetical protein
MEPKIEKYLELSNFEKDENQRDNSIEIPENNNIKDNKKAGKDELLLNFYRNPTYQVSYFVYCLLISVFIIIGYLLCYFNDINKDSSTSKQNTNIKQIDFNPSSKNYDKNFLNKIQEEFDKNKKVNINNIEQKLGLYKDNLQENEIIKSTVNIAFTLDPGYLLETMLTITSMIISQKDSTKLVFHLGVINNFNASYMLKMYELKERLNNKTEFNFYYLPEAMKKMKNFHPKGAACPGKFELPELLPDDVSRILLFDGGDVLVLRDLTELYNYDMGDKWALGPPEPLGIPFISKYNRKVYINIGSILLNVKELKKNKFWEQYTKSRHLDSPGAPDQTLFNIVVPDDKKGYFPFRFGGFTILANDESADKLDFHDVGYKNWLKEIGKNLPENPITEERLVAQLYNSVFIHQFHEKWDQGSGLSIYRHLAKYFIKLGGFWDELCKKRPGYCI